MDSEQPTQIVLTAGTQLGPYRIESLLGAGGMGQVFRGVDTRLGRPVAIKLASEQFTDRFEREARAISALNHPHICTLYDIGIAPSGFSYLVMELVEGDTLAARLKHGALPMDQVLRHGAEIANALAAAHAKGITHRDLKPGNIMLARSGVKVLDFGLARSVSDDTLTLTRAVIGTPAYMAPEQREGNPCDSRTDIYALGLILAEMATGKRVWKDERFDLNGLPERIRPVVRSCLELDPAERWQSAKDLQNVLQWPVAGPPTRAVAELSWRGLGLGITAGAVATAVAIVAWTEFRAPSAPNSMASYRLDIPAPSGTVFRLSSGVAISPDGRRAAFVAGSRSGQNIWVRTFDAAEAQEVPGTDGGRTPFWSPDGKSLGFLGGGRIQRVELSGGPPRPVCDVVGGEGATWTTQGEILFNSQNDGPLLKVSADGGSASPLTTINVAQGENAHRYPQILPDGRHFLYFVRATDYVPGGTLGASGEYVSSLDDPHQKVKVLSSRTEAIFAPGTAGAPHSLLYLREDGTLLAQRFDVERFQLLGEPRVLARGLVARVAGSRLIDVSAAAPGTLVYGTAGTSQFQLSWYTHQGDQAGMIAEPGPFTGLRISPDGKRVAALRERAVWKIELTRGITTKVADGDFNPVWSPDSGRIVYTIGSPPNLFLRDVQSVAPQQRLTNSEQSQVPMDWSPDGRLLLYSVIPNNPASKNRLDLWTLEMQGDKEANAFTSTPFQETNGQFSPDGRWIAYTSDESGRNEIVVQSFPQGARKEKVSSNGGNWVRWSRDGKVLFYLAPDGKLMSVPIRLSRNEVEPGSPVPLFDFPNHSLERSSLSYSYDVSPDGRFLILTPVGSEVASLTVITNWRVRSP